MGEDRNEWETGDKAGLVSIGTHKLYVSLRGLLHHPSRPVVIIFPGSGAACNSWLHVSDQIASFARVLLYDRSGSGRSEHGPQRESGPMSALELSKLLQTVKVGGPYVLVAHSYGGCVAREFLQLRPTDVVGMVFSETGTETRCEHAEEQYETQILGDAPLSVIRGETAFRGSSKATSGPRDSQYQHMIQSMQKMDEELKREQLRLSRKSKFRNVPKCGHSVHLDCPEIVAEEVKWVLDNCGTGDSHETVSRSSVAGERGLLARILDKLSLLVSRR